MEEEEEVKDTPHGEGGAGEGTTGWCQGGGKAGGSPRGLTWSGPRLWLLLPEFECECPLQGAREDTTRPPVTVARMETDIVMKHSS